MMGKQDAQGSLFGFDNLHRDFIGNDSIFVWLALNAQRHFPDEMFASLYCEENGRPSKPPSKMLVLLLLQHLTNVSDAKAIECMKFDMRWKVALRLEMEEALCNKSCLQLFRTRLMLNEKYRSLLDKSVEACVKEGMLKSRQFNVATDTTPIFGRGAIKDTYNLIGDAIKKILNCGAIATMTTPETFAKQLDLYRFLDCSSYKGMADIDWSVTAERDAFLTELVVDAKRAIRWCDDFLDAAPDENASTTRMIKGALELINKIISQNVTTTEGGKSAVKQGVEKDRTISVTDPEMKHGRKSSSSRFDGHKGSVTVETQTGAILDADVKAGNSKDGEGHLASVEQAEGIYQKAHAHAENAAPKSYPEVTQKQPAVEQAPCKIEKAFGDCAYGSAENRKAFEEADRKLHAKQATLSNSGRFTKDDFPKNPETGARTCPAGHTQMPRPHRRLRSGQAEQPDRYIWPGAVCDVCPLREGCISPKKKKGQPDGRSIREHPEEALLEQARQQQKDPLFRKAYRERSIVERVLARLVQLGGRQARYFGRKKVDFQWMMLCVVHNLALAAKGKGFKSTQRTSWYFMLALAPYFVQKDLLNLMSSGANHELRDVRHQF